MNRKLGSGLRDVFTIKNFLERFPTISPFTCIIELYLGIFVRLVLEEKWRDSNCFFLVHDDDVIVIVGILLVDTRIKSDENRARSPCSEGGEVNWQRIQVFRVKYYWTRFD